MTSEPRAWRLFNDEERVLVALCRVSPATSGEAAPALDPEPDWERLVELALRSGLGPLLHRGLTAGVPGAGGTLLDRLSVETRQRLLRHAQLQAVGSALRQTALDQILERFEQAGIPTILYKGAAYVEQIYPEPALRPMSDVDLIVPGSRAAEATACLEELGYRVGLPLGTFGMPYESSLTPPQHWPAVDLHVHVSRARQTRIRAEELFERSVPRRAGPGRLLGPVESLLLHALHQVVPTQLLGSLQTFVDLRELLLQARPEWPEALRQARRWGLATVLATALAALDDATPGFLVAEERLRLPVGAAMLLRLRERWRITEERPPVDYRLRHIVKLGLVDRWSDRIGLAASLTGEALARVSSWRSARRSGP
jgi:hypothetical protein